MSLELGNGTDSAISRVNRDKGTALGGGPRSLHLQVAYAPVAQALVDSGRIQRDTLPRLQETLNAGLGLIFGTTKEKKTIATMINRMHAHVKGEIKEAVGAHKIGDPYDAMDQSQLTWVAATLIDSSIFGYEMFIKRLSIEDKDEYLENAKDLFSTLHLEPTALPQRFEGLQEYMKDMIDTEQVKVGRLARELAPHLTLSHGRLAPLTYPVRRIAVFAIPEPLRSQFGYQMSAGEQTMINEFAENIKTLVPLMPPYVRYFKQYRDSLRKYAS